MTEEGKGISFLLDSKYRDRTIDSSDGTFSRIVVSVLPNPKEEINLISGSLLSSSVNMPREVNRVSVGMINFFERTLQDFWSLYEMMIDGRLFMTIKELVNEGIFKVTPQFSGTSIVKTKDRFHFMFEAKREHADDPLHAPFKHNFKPINKEYILTKCISMPSTISITFASLNTAISFKPDFLIAKIDLDNSAGEGNDEYGYPKKIRVVTYYPHYLSRSGREIVTIAALTKTISTTSNIENCSIFDQKQGVSYQVQGTDVDSDFSFYATRFEHGDLFESVDNNFITDASSSEATFPKDLDSIYQYLSFSGDSTPTGLLESNYRHELAAGDTLHLYSVINLTSEVIDVTVASVVDAWRVIITPALSNGYYYGADRLNLFLTNFVFVGCYFDHRRMTIPLSFEPL